MFIAIWLVQVTLWLTLATIVGLIARPYLRGSDGKNASR